MAKLKKKYINNMKVYLIEENVYRVVIPFEDDTSLTIFLKLTSKGLTPCSISSKFMYDSLDVTDRDKIKELCEQCH
jgi:hypothetical protein